MKRGGSEIGAPRFRRGSVATGQSIAGVAQLAERQPSKLKVAGSTPVARLEAPEMGPLFIRQVAGSSHAAPAQYEGVTAL